MLELTIQDAADGIERALMAAGQPARAEGEQRYLKSNLTFFGTGVPAMRAAVVGFARTHAGIDHDELLALTGQLWQRPIFECRAAAVEMLIALGALLGSADLPRIESLIRESETWALVDSLAEQICGSLVVRLPSLLDELDRWAEDRDFWVRRSALLALLPPLKRGGGDFERFGRYADAMIEEKEFFIRKAIGWVLREVAKKRPDLVYGWLGPRAHRASGVTMREAVRWLPAEQREVLMQAYREKRPG